MKNFSGFVEFFGIAKPTTLISLQGVLLHEKIMAICLGDKSWKPDVILVEIVHFMLYIVKTVILTHNAV